MVLVLSLEFEGNCGCCCLWWIITTAAAAAVVVAVATTITTSSQEQVDRKLNFVEASVLAFGHVCCCLCFLASYFWQANKKKKFGSSFLSNSNTNKFECLTFTTKFVVFVLLFFLFNKNTSEVELKFETHTRKRREMQNQSKKT